MDRESLDPIDLSALEGRIRSCFEEGKFYLYGRARSRKGEATPDEIAEFLEEHDLAPLKPEHIIELDRADAETLLKNGLELDFAYRNPRMTAATAAAHTADFLSLFSGEARYFTNSCQGMYYPTLEVIVVKPFLSDKPQKISTTGYSPITDCLVDTGVIAIDQNTIGMLWFADND